MTNINIYNQDCMEAMAKMPNNAFELAIVDPPYGIGADGQKESVNNKNPKANRKAHKSKNWDKTTPGDIYFSELTRVSKEQIIWGANYFVEYINKATKGWVVWYKGQEGLSMSDAEIAYSSFDQATRVVKINRAQLLKEGTTHPTQKPVALYKWLLKNYANEGDRILDTHLGSGSIAIACHDMGFSLEAYEIDQEYYEAAMDRLKTHQSQLQLNFN